MASNPEVFSFEHYKDDLHYQASMYESSFVDGYKEGEAKARYQMILNMTKNKIPRQTIINVTGLTAGEIQHILEKIEEQ